MRHSVVKPSLSLALLVTVSVTLNATLGVSSALAAPTVTVTDPATGQPIVQDSAADSPALVTNSSDPAATSVDPNSLAAQLQPTDSELSAANQELLSRNAKLQRQVNDLQTQVNVLVYESQGQLFLYGAFTVLISLLVGIFISWLVFVRRQRW